MKGPDSSGPFLFVYTLPLQLRTLYAVPPPLLMMMFFFLSFYNTLYTSAYPRFAIV